jgi:hypothetical protein
MGTRQQKQDRDQDTPCAHQDQDIALQDREETKTYRNNIALAHIAGCFLIISRTHIRVDSRENSFLFSHADEGFGKN